MRALIVDSGEGRGALAAVRGLARTGWTVGVACPTRGGLPARSRFARHWHPLPPISDEEAFLQAVRDAVAAERYDVVFGCSDAEILTLSERRESIPARVPYPPHETMLRSIDKAQLARAASTVGIATPPSVSSVAQARQLWGPVALVVKESQHGSRDADASLSHIAPQRFDDPLAAEERVLEIRAGGGVALVQPMLAGRLMAFTCVVDERGEMLGRVQQIAERTYPLDVGLSARARTVAVDEHLAERVGALLGELGWFGLVELQFLARDGSPSPSDGRSLAQEAPASDGQSRAQAGPTLLDFNGRFYGSLALSLAAGVNLPDLWGRAALGLPIPPIRKARAGVRYQWLEGDLKAARERSRATIGDVADCLRYALLSKASIWSPSDPAPGLLVAGAVLRAAAMTARRGATGASPQRAASKATREAADTVSAVARKGEGEP